MKEKEERERKKESSRAAHNYRLYFQIAACESSPRAQIARVIEFSLLGLVLRGMVRRGAFRVPTLGRTNPRDRAIVNMERTGGYTLRS